MISEKVKNQIGHWTSFGQSADGKRQRIREHRLRMCFW